jgi:IstB-like ATP binding protein
VTTNLAFKHWDSVFPNGGCAVALIDRLTHLAEIIAIEGESYRRRDAQAQRRKLHHKPHHNGRRTGSKSHFRLRLSR